MIKTDTLPQSAPPAAAFSQPVQKAAVCPAAAAQQVLPLEAPEADDGFTIRLKDGRSYESIERPQPKSSPERDHRDTVRHDAWGRLHSVLAAEQMDFVAEITQTLGRLK
jgi:hypothetical protein